MLATAFDKDGLEYVAAFEGKGRAGFMSGTQWHPEKNSFEWAPRLDVPRGAAATAATQYLARPGPRSCRTRAANIVGVGASAPIA